MINKKKMVTLTLLTALIMTLVFANLNVAPTGVAGTDAGAGNPGTTTTFNSNITMDFGSDNYTWLTNGSIMKFVNITGDAITKMENGSWFTAWEHVGMGFSAPKEGGWYYLYSPAYLYGMAIAIQVDTVLTPVGAYFDFNISQVYDMYYDSPKNYTIYPPVEAGTYIETECMIDPLTVCYDYFVLSGDPTDDSWWEIDYPSDWAGARFHIDDAYQDVYLLNWAHIDTLQVWNATAEQYDNVTSIPADPIPNEGFGGFELIKTVEPGTEYYIFSPTTLLPEPGSWWNITYPAELSDIQFNVSSSSEGNYFIIDTLWNTTAGAPVGSVTLEPDYSVSAVLATAPKVAKIQPCEWFNVIAGATPDPRSLWSITYPTSLAGVQFYVDMGGDGVFHIDEVLDDTGQHVNITVSPAAESVTAEQLIPAIYVYYPTMPINKTVDENFTISIKTNYTLNVWSYEFTLTYNPSVLNVINVTNGDLFAAAAFAKGAVDNVNGKLSLTTAYFDYITPPAPMTYSYPGPGTLANVTFTVVGTGDSGITLGPETRLAKYTRGGYGDEQNIVDDATGIIEHGYFQNVALNHDVATTNIVAYYLSVEVSETYQTWTTQTNVTISNVGNATETFYVKLYYDQIATNWLIGEQTVTDLAKGESTTLTFNFDLPLMDVPLGYRKLRARAILAFADDANPVDNEFKVQMLVKLTGDLVCDGVVNATDFVDFCGDYPRPSCPPGINADLQGDGDVDSADFILLVGYYGKEQPYY